METVHDSTGVEREYLHDSSLPVSNNEDNDQHETSAHDAQYHADTDNEQHSACKLKIYIKNSKITQKCPINPLIATLKPQRN